MALVVGDFDNSDHPPRFFLSNYESHFEEPVYTLPYMLPGTSQ